MIDLERLDEALEFFSNPPASPLVLVLWSAARAHRNWLVNGERVEVSETDQDNGVPVYIRRARQRKETQEPRPGWLPTDDVIERDYEEILGRTDLPAEDARRTEEEG